MTTPFGYDHDAWHDDSQPAGPSRSSWRVLSLEHGHWINRAWPADRALQEYRRFEDFGIATVLINPQGERVQEFKPRVAVTT